MPTRSPDYNAYSTATRRSSSPNISPPVAKALQLRHRLLDGEDSGGEYSDASTQAPYDNEHFSSSNRGNELSWLPVARQALVRASARRGFILNPICLPINLVVWATIWVACVGLYVFVYFVVAIFLSDLDSSRAPPGASTGSWWSLDFRPFWANRYVNLPGFTNELPMLFGVFVPCLLLRLAIEGGVLNEFL
ncbi:hypothetical protein B0T22DRAFT_438684 [Podospora appendiculata]|uniref:Uncharacterized protein n=1 Tax=Podospora appendiculata TaxID=314037 RepID=A0AAE0XLX9_9PEZI|nr:hypothetical protein B0T22DRAFT_438684 [Podospora appendiculata]